jgi:hypothetical protein
MDWFRWHHGSVNDPKFGLVAKQAGASTAEVVAVWACLLEAASAAEDRGDPGSVDFEAIDYALGLASGSARRIYERMRERGLLDGETGRISSWDKRQPKRERDDSSTERVRAYRAKKAGIDSIGNANDSHVTPRNAMERQETPRGEEIREEIQVPTVLPDSAAPNRSDPCPTQELVDLYHRRLPMLPRVSVMSESRKRAISGRWREVVNDPDIRKAKDPKTAAVEWFDWFFGYVAQSSFLAGKAKDWRADIDFLFTPAKFAKVVEGHYHKERA